MIRPVNEQPAVAPKRSIQLDLTPRTDDVGGRYSRFVSTAKVFLPGTAILLLLVVLIASALHKTASDVTISLSDLRLLSGTLGMSNPTFTYTNAESRTFLVNAKRATQLGNRDLWQLERIDGHMLPVNGVGYRLVSDTGKLDSAQKLFDLSGSVLVVSDQGYTFEARSAHVDMKQNRVTSQEPVKAKVGVSSVSSDRFEMWDKGNRLRFEGRVHFVSEAAPRKAGAPAAGTGQ